MMFFKVIFSKIEEFLEKIPSSRILNRFTQDLTKVDEDIDTNFAYWMAVMGLIIADIVTSLYAVANPYFLISFFIMIVTSLYFQKRYMAAKREITRLEAVQKTPILSVVNDLVRGLPNIRGLGKLRYF
jgi:ATP-binding cassette, subfamily C (CFTR/MRP), member 1